MRSRLSGISERSRERHGQCLTLPGCRRTVLPQPQPVRNGRHQTETFQNHQGPLFQTHSDVYEQRTEKCRCTEGHGAEKNSAPPHECSPAPRSTACFVSDDSEIRSHRNRNSEARQIPPERAFSFIRHRPERLPFAHRPLPAAAHAGCRRRSVCRQVESASPVMQVCRDEHGWRRKRDGDLTGSPSRCDGKAERVGFEPTVGVTLRRFSRPVHSAALPPLRKIRLQAGRRALYRASCRNTRAALHRWRPRRPWQVPPAGRSGAAGETARGPHAARRSPSAVPGNESVDSAWTASASFRTTRCWCSSGSSA